MAAPRPFDVKRARIAAIGDSPGADAADLLRPLLADKNGFLVGDAAKVVAKLELAALIPDLVAAFARLLVDSVKNDKTCAGKIRVVEALMALGADQPSVYLAGLRHVQLEPAFGGAVDTAAALRGLCAHALVEIDHREALLEIAPLLADPEPLARAEAANALGRSGIEGAAAPLHVKALLGDEEAEVSGACYRALLRCSAKRYIPFVASVLERGEGGVAEVAAFALGESREADAFAVLVRCAEGAHGSLLDAVLIAMATSRLDAGSELLLKLVKDAPISRASSAVRALALLRHDEALAARVEAAVRARGHRALRASFEQGFGRV